MGAKQPLQLRQGLIAGSIVGLSGVIASSLVLGYSLGEIVTVSLGVATILIALYVIAAAVNRKRCRSDD